MFNTPEVLLATRPDQQHLFLPSNQASRSHRPPKNRNFCEEATTVTEIFPERTQKEIMSSNV